ncbi:hypothetical protein ACHAWC_008205 [Mediolabrus comicus]
MMMPSTNPSSSRSCLLKTLLLLAALCGSSSAANNIGRIDGVADIEGVGVGADPNPTKKVVFASPSSSSSSAATPHDAPVIVDRRNNNRNLKKKYDDVFRWIDTGSTKAAKAGTTKAAKAASGPGSGGTPSPSPSEEEPSALIVHASFDQEYASMLTQYLRFDSDDTSNHQQVMNQMMKLVNEYGLYIDQIISQSESRREVAALYIKKGLAYANLFEMKHLVRLYGAFSLLNKAVDELNRASEVAQEIGGTLSMYSSFGRAYGYYKMGNVSGPRDIAIGALNDATEGLGVVSVGSIQFQASCSYDEIASVATCDESSFYSVPQGEGEEICSLPKVFACGILEKTDEGEGKQAVAVVFTYAVHSDTHIISEEIRQVNVQGYTDQEALKSNMEGYIGAVLGTMRDNFPTHAIVTGWEAQELIHVSESEDTSRPSQIQFAFSSLLDTSHHNDVMYGLAILGSTYPYTAELGRPSPKNWAGLLIGNIVGQMYIFSSSLLVKPEIDDAVDAIPVHFANGMWGCIAVGLFAEVEPGLVATAYGNNNYDWFYNWGIYGTAKSGVGRNLDELGFQLLPRFYGHGVVSLGISGLATVQAGVLGIHGPIARNIIPVVMAGDLGSIYGLVVAVIIQGSIVAPQPQNGMSQYSLYTGFAHLASDLSGHQQEQQLFVGMILILIFAEALGGLDGMMVEQLTSSMSLDLALTHYGFGG